MKYLVFVLLVVLMSCTNNGSKTGAEKDSTAKANDSAGKEIIRKTP
jgi:hypothetical protein